MRIVYITAGAAGMYCGSCMRDNTLVRALHGLGHEALLIPTYTPITTDEPDASSRTVFMGGLNVYLQESSAIFRHTPRWLDRLLDARWLLKWIGQFAGSTPYDELAGLTLSMLRGTHGHQRKEVDRLAASLASDIRPEIIHLTNALLSGLVPALKQRMPDVPIVVELQGDDIFLNALPSDARQQAIELIRTNGAQVAGFQATSTAYADAMASYFGIDRQRISVVLPGIELANWPTPPVPPARPFTVGYFARICPEKGFHHAVSAFQILKRHYPEAELHVGGWLGPANKAFFNAQCARLKEAGVAASMRHIECPGLSEKRAFMLGCDILSVPTVYHEPKGLYVLEAWAAGVPVVQPAHGSFPELIQRGGGGILVTPDNPEALAEGWIRLATNPEMRQILGAQGRQSVESLFTARQMAAETSKWYGEVIASPPNQN